MKVYKLVAGYQYMDAPSLMWWVSGKCEAKAKAKTMLNSQIGEHEPFEVIVSDEDTGRIACQLRLTTDGELVEHFAKW
nr:MAG TPA: hypothetical protein [Caudoviricetes sp.]